MVPKENTQGKALSILFKIVFGKMKMIVFDKNLN